MSQFTFAHRFDQVSGSAIREIFKVITQPGMISFAGGNPSPAALPDDTVRVIADEVLREKGKVLLQYGATEGYPPFVESLLQYVRDMLKCDIPAVLPVTGSTQAMDLLCKALIDPGDNILIENPSFLGNMQCMKLYQANLVPVESDGDGMIMSDLEEKIRQYSNGETNGVIGIVAPNKENYENDDEYQKAVEEYDNNIKQFSADMSKVLEPETEINIKKFKAEDIMNAGIPSEYFIHIYDLIEE